MGVACMKNANYSGSARVAIAAGLGVALLLVQHLL